jgi:transposase InsO family protein
LEQPRSTQRYEPAEDAQERRLVRRMLELVRERPRFGYRRITKLLRREGWTVNPKRVHRLWKREGLKVPKKQRKKRALGGVKRKLHRALHKDHVWA